MPNGSRIVFADTSVSQDRTDNVSKITIRLSEKVRARNARSSVDTLQMRSIYGQGISSPVSSAVFPLFTELRRRLCRSFDAAKRAWRRRVCTRHLANPSIQHHRERQVRWSYSELSFAFLCCPGWMQVTQLSFGCNQPICSAPCLNGGVCSSPETCTCRKGFIGGQCETDVDECLSEKPCGQLCRNLAGSYECYCRPGYHLQQDGQSCRRNDTEDTAFEARDLENDYFHVESDESTTSAKRPAVPTSTYDTENEVGDADLDQDYEIILKRLTKLGKQVVRGRRRETERSDTSAIITTAVESINEIKRIVESMQSMQQEIYKMRSKMKEYESKSGMIQHLSDRVIELENRLRTDCGSVISTNESLRNNEKYGEQHSKGHNDAFRRIS